MSAALKVRASSKLVKMSVTLTPMLQASGPHASLPLNLNLLLTLTLSVAPIMAVA